MSHRVLVPPPVPPPPAVLFKELVFAPTAGQTLFALSPALVIGGLNYVAVNGVTYDEATDYNVTTTQLQWLNNEFSLQVGDEVIIRYQT